MAMRVKNRIGDEMLDEMPTGQDPAEAFRNGDLLQGDEEGGGAWAACGDGSASVARAGT